MKKIILISILMISLMPFIMAEKPSDITSLEKTTHQLATTVFEKFSYFPLSVIEESKGLKESQPFDQITKFTSIENGMVTVVTMAGRKVCWRCQCTKCSWHGNTYGCTDWVSLNPCGGWNCPIHGLTLRTVSCPCEPNGTCTF